MDTCRPFKGESGHGEPFMASRVTRPWYHTILVQPVRDRASVHTGPFRTLPYPWIAHLAIPHHPQEYPQDD